MMSSKIPEFISRRVWPLDSGEDPVDFVLRHYTLPFTLRGSQIWAINELANYNGSGCYADVGTGKTVISTMLALYFGLRGEADQVLVIMPPILLLQWQKWIKSFPELSLTLYMGSPSQRKELSLRNDVILMSLNIFKNDYERITTELADANVFTIVDEAAKIRRIGTGNYKSVRDFLGLGPDGPIGAGTRFFTLLTGTPINRPDHCYAYLSLVTPGEYRDWTQFILYHVSSNDQYGEPAKFKNLDDLAENMARHSIRLDADEVLDLPEVVYDPVEYNLDPKHKKLYAKVVEDKLVSLDDGTVIDGTIEQRLYHALQRVMLMPAEFGGEKIKPRGFEILENMIDEVGILENRGEKLIVYAHHQPVNDALAEFANKIKGVNALQAYGKHGAQKNLKHVQMFLDDPSVNVLIANPGSVGIGLNLQSVCRAILFMELPITPNDFIQAVGRIKREGQTRSCLIRMAVALGTIQESLGERIVKKEDIAQRVMPTKDTIRRALMGGG